jgi:hypothetical protein
VDDKLVEEGIKVSKSLVKFIFSWIILMPIAVIVSGKLLSCFITLPVKKEQYFGLNIKIVKISAHNDEVYLGFGLFLLTFSFAFMLAGQDIYSLVKTNLGSDLGQPNSICFFSSLISLLISIVIFILLNIFNDFPFIGNNRLKREHDALINKLSR